MPSRNASKNSQRWWQTSSQWESIGLAVLLTIACVVGRLLLDQPNFKPSMAAAILAGAVLTRWRLAVMVPVVSAMATDLILGTYELPLMVAVYACMTLPVFWFRAIEPLTAWLLPFAGKDSRAKRTPSLVLDLALLNLGSVVAAIVFYTVTSFVVWSATPWYPDGFGGLSLAYWNAIPFLRWMIQGNLVFLNSLAIVWLVYRTALATVPTNDAQPVLPQ